MNPVDKLIADIEKGNFVSFVQSGTERLHELLDAAASLFEQFHPADQAIAYSLLFGMLIGSIEGQSVDIEMQGCLMTYEDRIRIFVAMTRKTAQECMEDLAKVPSLSSTPMKRLH